MSERPVARDTYEKFADAYAAKVETKPHNAFYDRPAIMDLVGDVSGLRLLDAGCGPGVYAKLFLEKGAKVTCIDVSSRMIELTRERLGDSVETHVCDLAEPLEMFGDECFDLVVAPLCLDYIEDWTSVFREIRRLLVRGGRFVYSAGHPQFDAEYFRTEAYFSVEPVQCEWTGFGESVMMPSYRRSLEHFVMPVLDSGLALAKLVEPIPTKEFEQADPVRYKALMHRPSFLCIEAIKL